MTDEKKILTLTDFEIKLGIAEFCGWERWKSVSGRVKLTKPKDEQQRQYWLSCGDTITTDSVEFFDYNVPDYHNDLNAIHEAEELLNDKQYDVYEKNLRNVCMEDRGWKWNGNWAKEGGWMYVPEPRRIPSLTAKQRCKALLRTVGNNPTKERNN